MNFIGIDGVVFSAPDLGEARRFYADWGLDETHRGEDRSVFAAENGGEVTIVSADSADLPAPPDPNSNFRELIWGVESEADLEAVAEELGKDRTVSWSDGTVRTTDPNGIAIAFRVARQTRALQSPTTPYNSPGSRQRVDTPATFYNRARPMRIGHIVFAVSDMEAGEEFYMRRLGFRTSDRYDSGRAVFLRCAPVAEHHTIFFFNTRGGKTDFQHLAFEVKDIHEVFGGGIHMRDLGWETAVGPGRHPVSSAYFWYFDCPNGGAVEYYSDSDFVTDAWQGRSIDGLRFSEWHLRDGVGPLEGGMVARSEKSGT